MATLERLGFAYERAESLGRLRDDPSFTEAARPLVLVPDQSGSADLLTEVVGFAQEFTGQAFVAYLADTVAPADYKRLVRTGAADWIALGDCGDELQELAARVVAADARGRAAKIVSFVPSKGGVGTTTLVVETAVQLAARRKRTGSRTAILDLNLQGGTVADALDVEPRLALAEIIERPERLDEQLIDIFTSRYAKGLDVFASARNWLGADPLRPDIVFTFIDAIGARYDTVLLDLPVGWAGWTDTLLSGSDAVIVCGGDSVPALRHLTATLDHLDELSLAKEKVAAVVNAVEMDLLGRASRRALIERALPNRRTFLTRRDPKGAGQALDIGKPMSELAPHSKVVRDIKGIATWVATLTGQAKEARAAAPVLREAAA